MYELFDRGIRQYEEEINIVRLMRTLRYNCAVIDQILKERPLKKAYNRSTFENDKIKMKRGSFISAGTKSELSQIAGQTYENSDSHS